jgi:dynein heavy chain, axonemal
MIYFTGVYFVKKQLAPIPFENCADYLIYGDLATRTIDQLSTIVDEIFISMLSNPENHEGWPIMVARDVQKHIHSLKSTVYQVQGQIGGQTVLPMPVGVDKCVTIANKIRNKDPDCKVELCLIGAIEGAVIKWATQINDVMKQRSSDSFKNGQNPTPFVGEIKDV